MENNKAIVGPLEKVTRDQLIHLCETEPAMVADKMLALIKRDTAALPDTVFIRRGSGDDAVILKRHRSTLVLKESNGELLKIGKKWDMSISGLRRCNEYAALQVIRPETVIVDGKQQMNPYIVVDPDSHMPEVVYARCLVIGYSPMGTLNATDVMIRLDLNIYLLETFQKAMKQLKSGVRRIAIYGTPAARPKNDDGKPREGQWNYMPIHSIGKIGLWVNMASPEFDEILHTHTIRLKFIERLAQSFAERNAMKAHPAIPKSIHVTNGVAAVAIHGWTTDFDRTQLDELRELVQNDHLDEFHDSRGEVIDVESMVVEATAENLETVTEEVEGDRLAEKKEEGGEEEGGEAPEDQGDLLPQAGEFFTQLTQAKGRPGAKKILTECDIENLEEASPAQLQNFIDKATSTLTVKPA